LPVEGLSWDVSFENYVDKGIPEAPLMQSRGRAIRCCRFWRVSRRQTIEIQQPAQQRQLDINDYLNLTYIAGKSHLSHSENAQDDAALPSRRRRALPAAARCKRPDRLFGLRLVQQ